MAEALISYFTRKSGDQLIQEGRLLLKVHDDIEWIKSELEAMIAFLEDADKRRHRNAGIEAWVGQVRDLVYDAEDVIDEFVTRMGTLHRFSFIKRFKVKRRVGTQIKRIKGSVTEVMERRKRYHLQVALHDKEVSSPGALSRNSSRNSSRSSSRSSSRRLSRSPARPFIQEDDYLGIGKEVKRLTRSFGGPSRGPGANSPIIQEDDIKGIGKHVKQMTKLILRGDPQQRRVISVVGVGGVGKTTLVKEVYKRVQTSFECHSWISISKSYNVRDVLRNILNGFKASKNEPALDVMDSMDEGQLREGIDDYLEDKNYVLVLDGLWDARVWEEVKHAFPMGGVIIFTTRIRGIATPADGICQSYDLKPLPHHKAWKIFCKKAFWPKGSCPEDLNKEDVDALVERCGGLPLTIAALGGLMSTKNTTTEWKSVLYAPDWEHNHNPYLETLNQVLLLSYIHLPFYLNYCFLYIGLFPEDYEIGRKRLIRMWVAEGFVRKSQSKTEEEVASDYFTQLISRGIIQGIILHARDIVKACRVHEFMRDVAVHMFKKEKFGDICVDENIKVEHRQRRLSIYNNANNIPSNMGMLNLRSLLMFRTSEFSCSTLDKMLPSLKFLRVLDLQGAPIESLPIKVGNLIHLRYLDLRGTLIEHLPKSLKNLRNLQTLDIRNTKVKSLPSGIKKLQQLRHLHMASFQDRDKGFVKMPIGTKDFKCLQTLSGVESNEYLVKEVRSLNNLRKLYIGRMRETNSKELCVALKEMKNLRSLILVSLEELQLESLTAPSPYLEKLKLQGPMQRLPNWFGSLNGLHILYLFKNALKENPFLVQKLPNLVVLILASSAFVCKEVCCGSGGFPKLRLLKIIDMEQWVTWKAVQKGTLQSLQHLLIANCPRLMELPQGFQHLTALQDLSVKGMSHEFLYSLRGMDQRKVRHVRSGSCSSLPSWWEIHA